MRSFSNLIYHFATLASMVTLAYSKPISGTGNITMTDLNTGTLLGCLNAQGEVQNIETTGTTGPCNQFIAVPASGKGQGGNGAVIFAAPGVPCTFQLIDGPGSEDQFMCDSSLVGSTTLNVWSVSDARMNSDVNGAD
jgi:hypothetical protein